MGFAASAARRAMLTARLSDLQLQGQFINQAKMQIANMSNSLFNATTNLEPESPQAQLIQQRIAALQTIEKMLDMQLARLDSQEEAVKTELEVLKKVIDESIARTFKTFG